jgi:uncharacterized protein (DUF4415 family)
MKRTKRISKTAKTRGKVKHLDAAGNPRYLPEDLTDLYRPVKKPVTLRLDADVVEWFQRDGRGYQTRINRVLRKVMIEERKKG